LGVGRYNKTNWGIDMCPNSYTFLTSEFGIKIDYKKNSGNPSRVFQVMSDLIDACQRIDKRLAELIDVNIEPVLLLVDIHSSSIQAWLSIALISNPDDSLYPINWKPLIGQFLIKGKKSLIDFMKDRPTITNTFELRPLEDQIMQLTEMINLKLLPTYSPLKQRKLLESLKDISMSLSPLIEGDSVKYISLDHGESTLNLKFKLSSENIEDLITKETTVKQGEKILKIKKADYLGESMWDFKHGQLTIQASISDKGWLTDFQSGKITILPGDSLRAIVSEYYRFDQNNNLIGLHYRVERIAEIIHASDQPDMFSDD
jgi:hypothetical protein